MPHVVSRRNALSRKGKAENTEEGDMDIVVSIHNNMNELTWKKILEWEKLRRCVQDLFLFRSKQIISNF